MLTRFAIAVLIAGPALAQTQTVAINCGPRAEILAKLRAGWEETTMATGLMEAGAIAEVLTNPETGTWTIIITDLNGQSCVGASGTDWATYPQAVGDPT